MGDEPGSSSQAALLPRGQDHQSKQLKLINQRRLSELSLRQLEDHKNQAKSA